MGGLQQHPVPGFEQTRKEGARGRRVGGRVDARSGHPRLARRLDHPAAGHLAHGDEDVEARRSFIVRNAKDIRFLDV